MRMIALLGVLFVGCVDAPKVVHPCRNDWGYSDQVDHKEIIERLDRIETLLENQRSKNAD